LKKLLICLMILGSFLFAENTSLESDVYIFFTELRASKSNNSGVALHSIEFDNEKSCQNAVAKYLALNNDDRFFNQGIRSAFCFKKNIKKGHK